MSVRGRVAAWVGRGLTYVPPVCLVHSSLRQDPFHGGLRLRAAVLIHKQGQGVGAAVQIYARLLFLTDRSCCPGPLLLL